MEIVKVALWGEGRVSSHSVLVGLAKALVRLLELFQSVILEELLVQIAITTYIKLQGLRAELEN